MRKSQRLGALLLIAILAAGVLGPGTPQAGAQVGCTITVLSGDSAGLRDAITQVNSLPGGGTICLTESTYTLTEIVDIEIGRTGLPGITSNITIEGNGATIERIDTHPDDCEISPECFRIFRVDRRGTLTLKNLTIRNGKAWNREGGGGGIHNSGTLIMDNVTIANNFALRAGGGLFNNTTGVATLNNVRFGDNWSDAVGGAIYNVGDLTLESSLIGYSNTAVDSGGGIYNITASSIQGGNLTIRNSRIAANTSYHGSGGGIYNTGTARLYNSRVDHNAAGDGGGIYNIGYVILGDATVVELNLAQEGGGIYNGGTYTNPATLIIQNSAISGNQSDAGGGILNERGYIDIEIVSLIEFNIARMRGGGIYNRGGIIDIANSILTRNTAEWGGGGIFQEGGLSVRFSVFSYNNAPLGGGLYNISSDAAIHESVFEINRAEGNGGGAIYNESDYLDVRWNCFESNDLKDGITAGIRNAYGGLDALFSYWGACDGPYPGDPDNHCRAHDAPPGDNRDGVVEIGRYYEETCPLDWCVWDRDAPWEFVDAAQEGNSFEERRVREELYGFEYIPYDSQRGCGMLPPHLSALTERWETTTSLFAGENTPLGEMSQIEGNTSAELSATSDITRPNEESVLPTLSGETTAPVAGETIELPMTESAENSEPQPIEMWCKWDGAAWYFEGEVDEATRQSWIDAGYVVAPANADGTCPAEPPTS